MNDFDYDCLLKKRLARQASHRKRGGRSRRCPMSTDYMTEKQWKERNGKIVSVQFSQPTSWENFKELPKDIQEEYLKHLSETYGANIANLSEMFDVSPSTIRRYLRGAELNIKFRAGRSMNASQREVWEKFLHTELYTGTSFVECNKFSCDSEHGQIKSQNDTPVETSPMQMEKFSLCFSGHFDIDMVANSLRRMIHKNSVGKIEIVCTMTDSG